MEFSLVGALRPEDGPVRIGVIGAGPSGLSTAAVLQEFGHEVVVFEKAPDVGGVWSSTRAYPGLSTQDTRVTYAFSDFPMPADFPEHPTGAHVRSYLEGYARAKGVLDRVRLDTRVESAAPTADGAGWTVQVTGPDGPSTVDVDWLVVANGVFSTPNVPSWPGRAAFEAHGGQVLLPTELGDGAALAGNRVLVVGWGKTACDIAAQSSRTARSTTVVARTLRWKIPKRIAGGLTFRHLLLTRLGEHLLTASRKELLGLVDWPVRRAAIWLLRARIARRLQLPALGMVPTEPLPWSDSLVTEGFFEAVADERIDVRREQSVQELGAADGVAGVRLSDGSWLPTDVVVAATGFDQDLSFLAAPVRAALVDSDGTLHLQRRILPLHVPQLAFAGWGHTYRSPLTAEIGAVWLAAHLAGALVQGPGRSTPERYHLTNARARALGEAQVPSGSFKALDALLDDLGLPLPADVRRRQWTQPLDPASYAYLVPALRRRLTATAPAGRGSVPLQPAAG